MSNIEQELASDVPPWLQRLLEARKRAGLTQEELGRRIGKSQKTVNGYEHGRKPNVSIYRQIAAACDVSETWLILGEGAAERQKVVSADQSVGRYPDRKQSVIQAISETDQEGSLFAWAIEHVSNVFLEEGIRADHRHLLMYTKNLLRLVKDAPDQAHVKDLILRAVERDRSEFRRQLNLLMEKMTTPRPL